MAAAQKASLHSFQELAYPEGALITYENDGVPYLGVVLSSKKEKVALLNHQRRELELASSRLYRLPGRLPQEFTSLEEKEKYLRSLRDEASHFAATVDLEELWKLLREDASEFSNQQICELYYGSNQLLNHLGLRFALLSDNTFFKRNKESFLPRSAEVVEDLKRAKEAKERKQQLQKLAIDVAGERLKNKTVPIPQELKPLLQSAAELAALSPNLDHAQQREAIEFVETVASAYHLNLGGQPEKKAYDLLMQLGVFNSRTNPRVIRHKPPTVFPEEVLAEAREYQIPETLEGYLAKRMTKHRNLTDLRSVTIDDITTRDMDDALSIVENPNGYTLYIHVSDVASFLPKGTALDKEAMRRATSLYLPEEKIHMLPPCLSEDGFSLLENEVRPALSCIFEINRSFEVQKSEITLSLIRVTERLNYDEIDEAILQGLHEFDLLHQIASSREAQRIEKGGFKVQKRDVAIDLDENGIVSLREVDENSPARSMIGEMMILANECIARFCQTNNLPIPYRGQETSDSDERALADIPQGPAFDFAIKSKLKRSETSFSPIPHANLGLELYTQATSPIRRYLDLCVQRQVLSFIYQGVPSYSLAEFEEINSLIQANLATALSVARESKRYWLYRYLQQVALLGRNIKGVVVRTDLRNPLIELDEVFFAVPARINGNFKLGDSGSFKILSVDPLSDHIRLESLGALG